MAPKILRLGIPFLDFKLDTLWDEALSSMASKPQTPKRKTSKVGDTDLVRKGGAGREDKKEIIFRQLYLSVAKLRC